MAEKFKKYDHAIHFRKALEDRLKNMARERAEMLQEKAKKDLSDWFQFLIGLPMREFDQAVYGGWRYPVGSQGGESYFFKILY